MARVEPAVVDGDQELEQLVGAAGNRLGFVPNSMRLLAHRPEILKGFRALTEAINGRSATIEPSLRNLVAQMASRAAGCTYCMAHTAHGSERSGIPAEKEDALWTFESSPLFSDAEKAALRVARAGAQTPSAATDSDFDELKRHYSTPQIVEIVAVVALYGFYNRFNDTLATDLEASPMEARRRFVEGKSFAD